MNGLQIYNSDGTSIVSSINTTGAITGTGLTINNGSATINDITVGRGGNNSLSNTAVGYSALQYNDSGSTNTAVGYSALQYNDSGSSNTAVGYTALQVNTTGNDNSAFGTQSLFQNTNGAQNSGFGFNSLAFNTVGYQNSALGNYSLAGNIEGIGNTGLGYSGLGNNNTGNYNVAVGHQSLLNNIAGSYNTAIGSNSGGAIDTYSSTAIGADSKFTGDHQIVLGTSAETIYVQGGLALKIGETLKSTGPTPIPITLVSPLSQIYFLGNFENETTIYFDLPSATPGQTITFRRLVNTTNSNIIKFSVPGTSDSKMIPYNSNSAISNIEFSTTNYSTTFVVGNDGFFYQTYLQ
jgi:uncharacterized protein (DUF779 family)